MKSTIIQSLTDNFESHAKKTENAVEFWLARDLQQLLGYEKWDNFKNIISKAKTACELSDSQIADHFADVGKMVTLGSGRQKLLVSYLTVKLQTILLMSGKWSHLVLEVKEKWKILCSLVMPAILLHKTEIREKEIKNLKTK